jgi:hypothetical protein
MAAAILATSVSELPALEEFMLEDNPDLVLAAAIKSRPQNLVSKTGYVSLQLVEPPISLAAYVDSGASYNFIDSMLVETLKGQGIDLTRFKVPMRASTMSKDIRCTDVVQFLFNIPRNEHTQDVPTNVPIASYITPLGKTFGVLFLLGLSGLRALRAKALWGEGTRPEGIYMGSVDGVHHKVSPTPPQVGRYRWNQMTQSVEIHEEPEVQPTVAPTRIKILPRPDPTESTPEDTVTEDTDSDFEVPPFLEFMRGEAKTREGKAYQDLLNTAFFDWADGDVVDVFSIARTHTRDDVRGRRIQGKDGIHKLKKTGEERERYWTLLEKFTRQWGWHLGESRRKKGLSFSRVDGQQPNQFMDWYTQPEQGPLAKSPQATLVRVATSLVSSGVTHLAKQLLDRYFTSKYYRGLLQEPDQEVEFLKRNFAQVFTRTALKTLAAQVLILTNPASEQLVTEVRDGTPFYIERSEWADPTYQATFRAVMKDSVEVFSCVLDYVTKRLKDKGVTVETALYEGLHLQFEEHRILQAALSATRGLQVELASDFDDVEDPDHKRVLVRLPNVIQRVRLALPKIRPALKRQTCFLFSLYQPLGLAYKAGFKVRRKMYWSLAQFLLNYTDDALPDVVEGALAKYCVPVTSERENALKSAMFSQIRENADLGEKLLATGELRLGHTRWQTPSTPAQDVLTTGLLLQNRANEHARKWKGSNLLGTLWEQVRTDWKISWDEINESQEMSPEEHTEEPKKRPAKRKAKRQKIRGRLLRPARTPGAETEYTFRELSIRKSGVPGAGLGLFWDGTGAKGVQIPCIGKLIERLEYSKLTGTKRKRVLQISQPSRETVYVSASGVPVALNAWAFANEHPQGQNNCIFKGTCLVIAKDVRRGQELFVSYGEGFIRDYHVEDEPEGLHQEFRENYVAAEGTRKAWLRWQQEAKEAMQRRKNKAVKKKSQKRKSGSNLMAKSSRSAAEEEREERQTRRSHRLRGRTAGGADKRRVAGVVRGAEEEDPPSGKEPKAEEPPELISSSPDTSECDEDYGTDAEDDDESHGGEQHKTWNPGGSEDCNVVIEDAEDSDDEPVIDIPDAPDWLKELTDWEHGLPAEVEQQDPEVAPVLRQPPVAAVTVDPLRVRVAEDKMLAAGAHTFVLCQREGTLTPWAAQATAAHPKPTARWLKGSEWLHAAVRVPSQIIKEKSGTFKLKVTNPTERPVKLSAGFAMGMVESLNDMEVRYVGRKRLDELFERENEARDKARKKRLQEQRDGVVPDLSDPPEQTEAQKLEEALFAQVPPPAHVAGVVEYPEPKAIPEETALLQKKIPGALPTVWGTLGVPCRRNRQMRWRNRLRSILQSSLTQCEVMRRKSITSGVISIQGTISR